MTAMNFCFARCIGWSLVASGCLLVTALVSGPVFGGEIDEEEIPYTPVRGTKLVQPLANPCANHAVGNGTPAMQMGPVIPPLPAYYGGGFYGSGNLCGYGSMGQFGGYGGGYSQGMGMVGQGYGFNPNQQAYANALFPLQYQQLQSQLTVTQAEIDSLQRRLVEYDRSNRWVGGGNPLLESVERVKVALVEAQQRYQNLQYQLALMQQFRGYNLMPQFQPLHAAPQQPAMPVITR